LPDWAYRAAPQEARPPKPLAPSADVGQEELSVPLPPALGARSLAMLRGTLIHALFERLPATPVTERRAAALRFMAARGAGLDTAVQEAAVEAVLAVLDHPDYARLFGPESLAEVPFSAVVDGRVIAGSVDRLVVSDAAVEVVDFKSGRAVPASLGDIPVGYLRQMAAYVAALRVIFPDHTVTASLLFSEGPQLFTLPDAVLAAHVPGEKPDLSPA
jgi:ATP-dependent helicase/nuclease subunit A